LPRVLIGIAASPSLPRALAPLLRRGPKRSALGLGALGFALLWVASSPAMAQPGVGQPAASEEGFDESFDDDFGSAVGAEPEEAAARGGAIDAESAAEPAEEAPAFEPSPGDERVPEELRLWFAGNVLLGLGGEQGLDRALEARGYLAATTVSGGSVGIFFAMRPWLWLGGTLGLRARTWSHSTLSSASVLAPEGLARARLSTSLGRGSRLFLEAGVGMAIGIFQLNGVSSAGAMPRLSASIGLALGFDRRAAIALRLGWDYARGALDSSGAEVEMGRVMLSAGVEVGE